MNIAELQQQLFQFVKTRLPEDASVADEVAKLLDISSDSVYRRMRGDKAITIDELYKLATHYKISVDQIMNIDTAGFLFQGNLLNDKTHRYEDYLKGMLKDLEYFNSYKNNEFFYLCKDTPIFHYFNCKDLAAFKYYFWMGNLIYFPEFKNKKIKLEEYSDEINELGEKVINVYNQIDSVEIWNIESWNTTIHQVEYYLDNQMFNSVSDAKRVYEASEKVLDHLEEQAKCGYKFNINDPEKKPCGKYKMYFNETVIQDNSMMAILDNSKIAMIPHTAINYMMTRNLKYCENYYQYVQNLIRRSTLISEVSEKERSRFFKRMRDRIEKRKEALNK